MRTILPLIAAHLTICLWRVWNLGVPSWPMPHGVKRLLFSRDWSLAPAFHPPGSENPPLGFWIFGLWYKLFPATLLWFEIVVNISASALSLWLIFDLTRRLFKDDRAALAAGVLLLLHPLFSTWSATAGTFEPLFLTAVLAAANFLTRWELKSKPNDLFIASAAILISTGLRYEGWFFATAFTFAVLRTKRGPLEFKAVIWAWAFVALELIAWRSKGESLFAMQSASGTALIQGGNLLEFFKFQLLASPLQNLFILGAAAYAARQKIRSLHLFIGVFLIAYAAAAAITGAHPYEAHTLPPLALAIPFAGVSAARRLKPYGRAGVLIAVGILLLAIKPVKPPVWPAAEDVQLGLDLRRQNVKTLVEVQDDGAIPSARIFTFLTLELIIPRENLFRGATPAFLDEECRVGRQAMPQDSWFTRGVEAWRAAGIRRVIVNQHCTERSVKKILGAGHQHGLSRVYSLE